MPRQCLGRRSRPPRPPARSGSASTRFAAGIATARSPSSAIAANRRVVPVAEVERLRAPHGDETLSARNRFRGVVRSVELDGLLAKVEIDVTEPSRVVAIVTRESVDELGLKAGMSAAGVVKSTSVMVER